MFALLGARHHLSGQLSFFGGDAFRGNTVDGRSYAPNKKPWDNDCPVNTNKQRFPMVSNCCRISSIRNVGTPYNWVIDQHVGLPSLRVQASLFAGPCLILKDLGLGPDKGRNLQLSSACL